MASAPPFAGSPSLKALWAGACGTLAEGRPCLFRKFVETSATVDISEDRIGVALGRRAHNPHLIEAGYAHSTTAIP